MNEIVDLLKSIDKKLQSAPNTTPLQVMDTRPLESNLEDGSTVSIESFISSLRKTGHEVRQLTSSSWAVQFSDGRTEFADSTSGLAALAKKYAKP